MMRTLWVLGCMGLHSGVWPLGWGGEGWVSPGVPGTPSVIVDEQCLQVPGCDVGQSGRVVAAAYLHHITQTVNPRQLDQLVCIIGGEPFSAVSSTCSQPCMNVPISNLPSRKNQGWDQFPRAHGEYFL